MGIGTANACVGDCMIRINRPIFSASEIFNASDGFNNVSGGPDNRACYPFFGSAFYSFWTMREDKCHSLVFSVHTAFLPI